MTTQVNTKTTYPQPKIIHLNADIRRCAKRKFECKFIYRSKRKIELIPYSSILYLEASSNYTILYLTDRSKRVVSKCLKEVHQNLDQSIFYKCHQSIVMNLSYLRAFHISEHQLELTNGIRLCVSRSMRKEMIELFR